MGKEDKKDIFNIPAVVEGKSGGTGMLEKFDFLGCELFFSPMMEHAMRPYVLNSYEGVLKICEKFRPDLVEPLKKLNDEKNLWDRGCDQLRAGKTCFSCVCHGDARLKNMFLISPQLEADPNEGKFRFIDFQLSRYASPLTDLIYFIYLSTSRPFRQAHTRNLLKIYHSNFTTVLSAFPEVAINKEARGWTLEKLLQEYHSLMDYALVTAIAFIPTVYLRPEDIGDILSPASSHAEKSKFLIENRARVIADVANKNTMLRTRILDALDELLLSN